MTETKDSLSVTCDERRLVYKTCFIREIQTENLIYIQAQIVFILSVKLDPSFYFMPLFDYYNVYGV